MTFTVAVRLLMMVVTILVTIGLLLLLTIAVTVNSICWRSILSCCLCSVVNLVCLQDVLQLGIKVFGSRLTVCRWSCERLYEDGPVCLGSGASLCGKRICIRTTSLNQIKIYL